ncbi:hypothetical protein G6F45_014151 [Rhizopus arrhizus]|nr:hypothetical protein G6F45_014151 [Rhizopus arrhizus]
MGRAKRAIEALGELAPKTASVRRNGEIVEIAVEELARHIKRRSSTGNRREHSGRQVSCVRRNPRAEPSHAHRSTVSRICRNDKWGRAVGDCGHP